MDLELAASAHRLIAQADAHAVECERLAAAEDDPRRAGYWRRRGDAWLSYVERLRAIAERRSLPVRRVG